VVGADGLGRDGADLFAHHAGRLHGPGQAAAALEERGAEADGPVLREGAYAELLLEAGLLDGSGGAHLAAERAVELAEADGEIHHGRPQPLEPGLGEGGGLEDVGGADVDALIALDAPLEEL